jgi:PST family polysaccharide transporter
MTGALMRILPGRLREWMASREKLQHVLINVSWLAFDKLLRMGVGLFVGVWVARYLGATQFGLLNYALALVWLLSPFATLGLDSIVVRELVHAPDEAKANEIQGTAFALKFIGSLLILAVTIPTVFALRSDTLGRVMVAIIAVGTAFQSFDVIDYWFQSKIRSKFVVWARNGAFLTISVVKIVMLKMHAPLVAFAWASGGELMLGAIGLLICYRIKGQSPMLWRFSVKCAKALMADSWPLVLTGILITIYMRIDQLMLGQMSGDASVGLYSAAVKLAEVWYFIPLAFTSSIFPVLLEAKKAGSEIYANRLQLMFSGMAALGYVIVIPTVLLSHRLITLIYGHGFSAAGTSLMVLSWAFLFVCLGLATGNWLIAENFTKLSCLTTGLGAASNIALNFILIPRYGATGAGVATLISQFVSVTLAALIIPAARPAFWLQMKGLCLHGLLSYPRIVSLLRAIRVRQGALAKATDG